MLPGVAKRVEKGATLGGRFRLDEMIGGGGMGSVWAAHDLEQGHRVAVKLLHQRLAKATEFRERFLDESKHAASIPHPHILTVYDHGEDDGWHYLAMRLVEDDLAGMMERDCELELTRALNLADQVAWGLDVAHEQGLVHRDVKPENVLVTPRRSRDEPDHAYLCDFGIAKLEGADRALTRTGAFIGTVSYASPEQTRGQRLDGRSDQYSLACVLYEMLAGAPPFSGSSAEAVMEAHREGERPRASAGRPELPTGLDAVLARGMARDPDDRYPSCRELVAAARREARAITTAAAAGTAAATLPDTVLHAGPGATGGPAGGRAVTPSTEPVGAEPPTARVSDSAGATPRRRHPLAVAMTALVALVIVGVVLAVVLSRGDASTDRADAPSGPGTSPSPDQDSEAAEAAIEQTVGAYAAAEGEQEACATLVADSQSSCESAYAAGQPTEYDIERVEVADDEATVKATQAEFGDPIELELVRENSKWLIAGVVGFDWKDAEEVEAATAVARFARRDEDACDYLSRSASSQCDRLLPREPLTYDIDSVSASYGTGSVSGELGPSEVDSYSLVEETGQWRIEEID
jgi:serine/threonine-protein kinase